MLIRLLDAHTTSTTATYDSHTPQPHPAATTEQTTISSIPDQTRTTPPVPIAYPILVVYADLSPRRFKLLWEKNGQTADDKALEAYLEANKGKLELPNQTIDADGDPRVHDGYEFRDSIRLQNV
jgi:hypothetical protein